jgi:hypothetical protein
LINEWISENKSQYSTINEKLYAINEKRLENINKFINLKFK